MRRGYDIQRFSIGQVEYDACLHPSIDEMLVEAIGVAPVGRQFSGVVLVSLLVSSHIRSAVNTKFVHGAEPLWALAC